MLAYAEVHYKPGIIPSLIYKKSPEIVCDAPARIDPGKLIPVFVIIKDAHRFPVKLNAVSIRIKYDDGTEKIERFSYQSRIIDIPIWWDSVLINPEKSGTVSIVPIVELMQGDAPINVVVDNYHRLTQSQLTVYVSETPLPGKPGWYHGDIHCHTYYTSDQVEFGAPLEVLADASNSMGIQWFATTDHSYDLDDFPDDYERNDPDLSKWHELRENADSPNTPVSVIHGEEVTCQNEQGANCHMLSLNSSTFIKGSGDSGEQGLGVSAENTIKEAVSQCIEGGGIACAAHPLEEIPFLERVFLKRNKWTFQDMMIPGISALQIHNGVKDKGFLSGLKVWIRMLLGGRRIFIFGGNDSHGDMNRRRAVRHLLLSLYEKSIHTFGNVRTVVRALSENKNDIVEALACGRAVISEGPFIDLNVVSGEITGQPGDIISNGPLTIRIKVQSSPEFGLLKEAKIIVGVSGETNERILAIYTDFDSNYEHMNERQIDVADLLYIRAECITINDKLCITNPVWVENKNA